VREKSGLSETNDRTLISKALAGKNPRILVSDAPGDQGMNMREGTAYLALGIVARLRNVLTHEIRIGTPDAVMSLCVRRSIS
jgi:hypothetical protein